MLLTKRQNIVSDYEKKKMIIFNDNNNIDE